MKENTPYIRVSCEWNKLTPWNKKISRLHAFVSFVFIQNDFEEVPASLLLISLCIILHNLKKKVRKHESQHHLWVKKGSERNEETCIGFNEVTSPCVLLPADAELELRCVTGQSITVLPKARSHSEVSCWDRNEPAIQRGVRGVGPG